MTELLNQDLWSQDSYKPVPGFAQLESSAIQLKHVNIWLAGCRSQLHKLCTYGDGMIISSVSQCIRSIKPQDESRQLSFREENDGGNLFTHPLTLKQLKPRLATVFKARAPPRCSNCIRTYDFVLPPSTSIVYPQILSIKWPVTAQATAGMIQSPVRDFVLTLILERSCGPQGSCPCSKNQCTCKNCSNRGHTSTVSLTFD